MALEMLPIKINEWNDATGKKQAMEVIGRQVLKLKFKGWDHQRIEDHFGLEFGWVDRQLPRLLHAYGKEMGKGFGHEVALQLGKLDHMYIRALEQFEISCQPQGTQEVIQGGKDSGTRKKVMSQSGDPRFLAEARHILTDRRKLLGLENQDIKVYNTEVIQTNNSVNIGSPGKDIALTVDEMSKIRDIMKDLNLDFGGIPSAIKQEIAEEQEDILRDPFRVEVPFHEADIVRDDIDYGFDEEVFGNDGN